MSSPACLDCERKFGLFSSRKTCPSAEGGCARTPLCPSCLGYALCMEDKDKSTSGFRAKVVTVCKTCFLSKSSLDMTKTEDVLGPEAGAAPCILYVHGAGGCRLMFRRHAEDMVRRGMRCVLIDLPGHGGRMDEHLSMESSIKVIVESAQNLTPPCRATGVKPIIIGGSLGGYLTMELLGQHPDVFSAAVVMMCGQNVGVGRGMAASCGLVAMEAIIPRLRPATILTGLVAQARKNGHMREEDVLEMSLRPGMFFKCSREQVAILRESDPLNALPKFNGPILFVNGSRDHRDSEQKWLAKSVKGNLIVYEGADHFFSHDSRFDQRLRDDTWKFLNEWRLTQGAVPASASPTTV